MLAYLPAVIISTVTLALVGFAYARMRRKVAKLNGRISELQAEHRTDMAAYYRRLNELEKRVRSVEERLEAQLPALFGKLDDLESKEKGLQARLDGLEGWDWADRIARLKNPTIWLN